MAHYNLESGIEIRNFWSKIWKVREIIPDVCPVGIHAQKVLWANIIMERQLYQRMFTSLRNNDQ